MGHECKREEERKREKERERELRKVKKQTETPHRETDMRHAH